MRDCLHIGKREVGPGRPVYMVAELSANHNQSFEQAVQLIQAAKDAGADAVKVQTYTPDTITIQSTQAPFRIEGGTLWDGRTLYDLYSEAYMPWEWQPKLKDIAEDLEIDLFSSAFDPTAVDFLDDMGVPAYKVASFELVDIPLIQYAARKERPLILSTGMATLAEIDEAVRAAREAGATELALLKCNSAYPAPPEEMNLRSIPKLREIFRVPVGLSDHTLGTAVPIASVALGASIVEKHFTLTRDLATADSTFSVEPDEFKAMTEAIRIVERALGEVRFGAGDIESKSREFRRSLFVVEDIKAGEAFSERNVRSIRPAHGLPPKFLKAILGRHAKRDIPKGTPLEWEMVS